MYSESFNSVLYQNLLFNKMKEEVQKEGTQQLFLLVFVISKFKLIDEKLRILYTHTLINEIKCLYYLGISFHFLYSL